MKDNSVDGTDMLDNSVRDNPTPPQQQRKEDEEDELHRLLLPDGRDLPLIPPSAVESNFVSYFAPGSLPIDGDKCYAFNLMSKNPFITPILLEKFLPTSPCFSLINMFTDLLSNLTDFIKPGHDQYVYRHANG